MLEVVEVLVLDVVGVLVVDVVEVVVLKVLVVDVVEVLMLEVVDDEMSASFVVEDCGSERWAACLDVRISLWRSERYDVSETSGGDDAPGKT